MRLEKVIEEALQTSRKETKRYLKAGEVKVNQRIISKGGYNVDGLCDTINVQGRDIKGPIHHYYMLNKPQGVITANRDATQKTIFDLLPYHEGMSSVGRLDKDTTGLILVSDNGPLCYALTQKVGRIAKEYIVTVNGPLDDTDIAAFNQGIVFDDGTQCQPAQLVIEHCSATESKARVILYEGRRHQIKKMFLCRGVKVTALHRHRIGSLVLDPLLEEGQWRALTVEEVKQLMEGVRQKANDCDC